MTLEDFTFVLQNNLGLAYKEDDLSIPFDDLQGWDSVHLLRLVTFIPELSIAKALTAGSLREVYECL